MFSHLFYDFMIYLYKTKQNIRQTNSKFSLIMSSFQCFIFNIIVESLIVFCPVSVLVSWELMELGKQQPSKCSPVTLMSALERLLWLVTGT